jgi:hypothetical protein
MISIISSINISIIISISISIMIIISIMISIILSIIISLCIIIIISINIISPYVQVIKVLLTTASCGISRDQDKRLYGVERSFGATGLPEFLTSTQKEEKGGRDKG